MNKLLLVILSIILLCSSCVKVDHFPTQAINSFVKIHKTYLMKSCSEEAGQCSAKLATSSGSGAVISSGRVGGLVLTAAHVCDLMLQKMIDPTIEEAELTVLDLTMKEYRAEIINLDYDLDACVLAVPGIELNPLPIYKGNLELGIKSYNVAAPIGMFEKNMVPLLDGYYIGNETAHKAMFSIPAAGGSSGSPIVNSKGELIGMIHSVNVRFPMLTVSPELENLRKFIKQSKKMYNFIITKELAKENR